MFQAIIHLFYLTLLLPPQIVMSLFKLGVITLLLSDALISGYTAAAAFSIVVTQCSCSRETAQKGTTKVHSTISKQFLS